MLFYKFICLELFILAGSIPLRELSKENSFVTNGQLERKAFDSAAFKVGSQLDHSGKLDKRDTYQFNNPIVSGIHLPLKMGNIQLLRSSSVGNTPLDPSVTEDEPATGVDLFGIIQVDLSKE
jgi:hypothetical protein